jgi:hypothetical protein
MGEYPNQTYVPHVTGAAWAWVDFGDTPGMLGVIPAGVDLVFVDATDDEAARGHAKYREMKPGRVVRQLLTSDANDLVTDGQVEAFANRVKAETTVDERAVRLLRGDDVAHAYAHAETAIDSCMQGGDEDWFALYAENPAVCGLLTSWRGECLVGRALVWDTDHGRMLDRVYGNDVVRRAFADRATREGWLRRGSSYRHVLLPDGTEQAMDLTVRLDRARFSAYPYLDTFLGLRLSPPRLANGHGRYDHELRSQHGGPDLLECCAGCGAELDEDDDYVGGDGRHYCEGCHDDHTCGHCGEWTGDGDYCDACREQHVCADCTEYVEHGLTMNGDGDKGYCIDCEDAHTCACGAVEDELDDGRCEDCAAKVCPVCATEAPGCLITIFTGEANSYYDRNALWSSKRRRTMATRVTCPDCERSRLLGALSASQRAYHGRQVAAGQAVLFAAD